MLDVGWNELLIIALVTILVVGPKELPHVLRTVTQFFRKLRAMASEFQSGLDDLAREAELQDLKQNIEKTASTDFAGELEQEFDPTGEVDHSVRELGKQIKEDPRKAGKSTGKESGRSKPVKPATASEPSIAPPESADAAPEPAGGKPRSPKTASGGTARKPATKTKKKAGKAS